MLTKLTLPSSEYRSISLCSVSQGGIGLCGERLQELCSVYLTRFRTYKIALPPQT